MRDIHGTDHDGDLWPEPGRFRPERFLGRPPGAHVLIPQGGGDVDLGHRCAGERLTVELLGRAAVRLARLRYRLPTQDLGVPPRRIPGRVRSGVVMAEVDDSALAGA